MLIDLRHVTHAFGLTAVLEDVSLSAARGERIGIVGANGSGKTTLLRIAAGALRPDRGEIHLAPGVRIGATAQVVEGNAAQTLAGLLDDAERRVSDMREALRSQERALASLTGPALDAALAAYGELHERFVDAGGYDIEARLGGALAALGLDSLDRHTPLAALSGGEKTRASLAALLIRQPEVLLLDEPTNHLDATACAWLERTLHAHRGAALIVSHDRRFLDAVVTGIIELDEHSHRARNYGGSYSAYAAARAAEREGEALAYARQQEEMTALRQAIKGSRRQVAHNRPMTDNDKFAKAFFRGRVEGTISRNVRNAEQALARLEADALPKPARPLSFGVGFAEMPLRAPFALQAVGMGVRLGGREVLREVDLALPDGMRLRIEGPNGAGKTPLLRALAGQLLPNRGQVVVAARARIGFLEQEPARPNGDATLFELYRGDRIGEPEALLNELIWTGLFTYADTRKRTREVSAGQFRKLSLARLLAAQPNVLLLDEPTNHFSLQVVEQLEAALAAFPGPVIAVSHDARFAERFGGQARVLEAGVLRP